MKIKTSELDGAALDWAVAKCEGNTFAGDYPHLLQSGFRPPMYSCYWERAGQIIEREGIAVTPTSAKTDKEPWRLTGWQAQSLQAYSVFSEDDNDWFDGPTPLIAAMRCYVASKLGDTVDIPEELV